MSKVIKLSSNLWIRSFGKTKKRDKEEEVGEVEKKEGEEKEKGGNKLKLIKFIQKCCINIKMY